MNCLPDHIACPAYAKINWDLRILGKRADNFHELDSIFVNVDLGDSMSFERAASLSMTCTDATLPVDDSNLVMKAAKLLARSSGCTSGAAISLDKRIPMGGGLGGGSSDAACALGALNVLWGLKWSTAKLAEVAAQVGSDVSYFLRGGWCLCRGRGELVERLPDSREWPALKLLLILPPLHVATPAVYKALDYPPWNGAGGRDAIETGKKLGASLQALLHGENRALELKNDLSCAARQIEPGLQAIQTVLQNFFPDRWLMSGSGASHFAIPPQHETHLGLSPLISALNAAVPGTRVIETRTRSEALA